MVSPIHSNSPSHCHRNHFRFVSLSTLIPQAEFPYIFGVTAKQFKSEECQSNLEGVIVVQLDYDKVVVPKEVELLEFNRSFTKRLEKRMSRHFPPPASECLFPPSPSARVLYCDSPVVDQSQLVVFEIVFGPGKLGIRLKTKQAVLREGEPESECVYLTLIPDEEARDQDAA